MEKPATRAILHTVEGDDFRRRLWRRGEAMAAHNFSHLDAVRRSAGGSVDHRGGLTEILWTDCGGRNDTEGRYVLAPVIVESVNRAARNAEGLPWPDVDAVAVDGPRQHSRDAVDGLFVVIVAVRGRCQPL